jgi:hypothetical protein
MDVIGIGKNPGQLSIYYNESFIFTETILNDNFLGGASLAIIDIDNDGDDDIISGAGVAGELFLYENTLLSSIPDSYNADFVKKIYPNPFSKSINIVYEVKHHSKVSIIIYNNMGKEVNTLVDNPQANGINTVDWDGRNSYGNEVPSGIYFCRILFGTQIKNKKIILLNDKN